MITVVLADDHQVVRQGLRALLESEPDLSVVGEASDGLKALDLVEQLKPQVLVIDIMMPGLNGLEVIRQVSKRSPKTRAVVLSMYADEGYVLEAFRYGAAGYAVKGADAAELLAAVREVAGGRRYVSPSLSGVIVDAYLKGHSDEESDPYTQLTDREREVFQLMAEGHSNADIAQRLFISSRTVETHRAHVMQKLGLRTHTEIVRFALRRGILPPE